MDKQLLAEVETLRGKMVAAAVRQQNILHRDVLLLSQSLDQLILKVQTEKQARLSLKQ